MFQVLALHWSLCTWTSLIIRKSQCVGVLTICTQKTFFFGWKSNGTVQPGENFPESKECLRRCSSFFCFNRNDQDKLYHLQNLTRAILSPTVDDFVNLGTSRPSLPSSTGLFLTNGTASYLDLFLPEEINCSICPKNPTQKFHANGKRSKSSLVTVTFTVIQSSTDVVLLRPASLLPVIILT